ncbi:MAG: hypothetical protein IPG50_28365 [Myxococcales bacterium]|nr:hypothetical protein [Myxococcales bacterium]
MKRWSLLTVVAVALWVSPSAAQTPSPADRETARTLMDQGDRAYAEKRFADALRAYRDADAIMHVPTTGAELAKAHEALGQLLEAKEACRLVLAYPSEATEPAPFKAAREGCATLAQSLGDRIPSVTFRITGLQPSDAFQMTIDGVPVRGTSLEVLRRVNPGPHRVVIVAPGYDDTAATFAVTERSAQRVDLAMRALTSAATPVTRPLAAEPARAEATPSARPAPEEHAAVPLYAKVAFGVGAVGVGVGAVVGAMALSRVSRARELCVGNECDPAASNDIEASKSLSHVSTAAFAVGLVGASIGLVGLLTRSTAASSPRVEAYVNATGAGVAGSF